MAPESLPGVAPLIVIAAGGSSSRMGGDKPSRILGGKRLIDWMVDWATRHSDAVALSMRDKGHDWGTGLPVLTDAHRGIGPISALASAMNGAVASSRTAVLLIGCDMPFLPNNLLARLRSGLAGNAAVLPVSAGRLHPMAGLWRADPTSIEAWIAKGGQSLWGYARHVGMAEVVWTDVPDPFANINDPLALNAAEERLRKQAH